jgi:hypothetical protein
MEAVHANDRHALPPGTMKPDFIALQFKSGFQMRLYKYFPDYFFRSKKIDQEKLNAHWYSVSPTIGNTMLAVRCL